MEKTDPMFGHLRRIKGLFARYVMAHGQLGGRTGPIRDTAKRQVGLIKTLERDQNRLRVAGYISADSVTLVSATKQANVVRPAGHDHTRPLHFDLAIPLSDQPTDSRLIWATSTMEAETALRFPSSLQTQLGHTMGFTCAMVRLIPVFWGWWRTHDPRHRGAVKRGLGLDGESPFQPLKLDALQTGGAPAPAINAPITIILPVYNGLDILKECLARITQHTDLPWHLIVVDDASPDDKIRPYLQRFADQNATQRDHGGRVTLILSDQNMGFIGAVNTGLEAAGVCEGQPVADPIVLLNSDALVPANWASRLLAPLVGPNADPTIASVTPMSNDAEITTVPVICACTDLADGAADQIDAIAQTLNPTFARADMPTGVGFCMALSPHFLARLPRLDTAFGRGYGEEVDWCQKARALGGRHVAVGTLFVEHKGGTSFGSAAKATLIAQNGKLISQRYPAYDMDVARFMSADPLTTSRLALALVWAGTIRKDVPVYLAHDMGGGADMWLQKRIQTDLALGLPTVVLRVGGPTRWQIEIYAPTENTDKPSVTGGVCDDFEIVTRLLAILPTRKLIYSCGVGDPDPAALPDLMLSLLAPGDTLDVLFHDWLPISPSYTLLDRDGVYRGPVTPNRGDDLAHQISRPDGRVVSLAEWQKTWGRLMARADQLRVFSDDAIKLIMAAWPTLDPSRIEARGHPMDDLQSLVSPTPADTQKPFVIGILGHLNLHKGAHIVDALAVHFKQQNDPTRIVVLGRVDPECPMHRHVRVHGGYQVADIPDLVAKYGITHWLLPAIWPETFSYATHEALATGLPVLTFDLGAQGAAVARAPNGRAIPLDPNVDPSDTIRRALMS